jgi:hypothetical protein
MSPYENLPGARVLGRNSNSIILHHDVYESFTLHIVHWKSINMKRGREECKFSVTRILDYYIAIRTPLMSTTEHTGSGHNDLAKKEAYGF